MTVDKKEYQQKYYRKNQQRLKECNKKYYWEHRKEKAKYGKKYKRKNRKRIRKLNARDYYKHRKQRIKQRKKYKQERRKIVLKHYGNKCICCGESNIEFLQIDHINNDGSKFRKKHPYLRGTSFYSWIIRNNFPKDLQILCANCNFAKGVYGYCPHEKEKMLAL